MSFIPHTSFRVIKTLHASIPSLFPNVDLKGPLKMLAIVFYEIRKQPLQLAHVVIKWIGLMKLVRFYKIYIKLYNRIARFQQQQEQASINDCAKLTKAYTILNKHPGMFLTGIQSSSLSLTFMRGITYVQIQHDGPYNYDGRIWLYSQLILLLWLSFFTTVLLRVQQIQCAVYLSDVLSQECHQYDCTKK